MALGPGSAQQRFALQRARDTDHLWWNDRKRPLRDAPPSRRRVPPRRNAGRFRSVLSGDNRIQRKTPGAPHAPQRPDLHHPRSRRGFGRWPLRSASRPSRARKPRCASMRRPCPRRAARGCRPSCWRAAASGACRPCISISMASPMRCRAMPAARRTMPIIAPSVPGAPATPKP